MAEHHFLPEPETDLGGNTKVTRRDWLSVALDLFISDGVEQVKITELADRLNVSRSSFYWYFKSRTDLLDAILGYWERSNTGMLVRQAELPAETITEAVCNVFRCFIDANLFDSRLDFAVREWSRRSGNIRRIVDRSDDQRLSALKQMFIRHGYDNSDANARARILYYMQIGYYASELNETLEERLAMIRGYLIGFTGCQPRDAEIAALADHARQANQRHQSADVSGKDRGRKDHDEDS